MKRYRIFVVDFDTRARYLAMKIEDHWDEHVKEIHKANKRNMERELIVEFGEEHFERKLKNFIDAGSKPFSILAFHNRFLEQLRRAFVMGSYYPALTAACALGERILHHLMFLLRDDFKSKPEYKNMYKKKGFPNWDIPIDTLAAWDILLPEVANEFRNLKTLRNDAIHFRPDVDTNDRILALAAIKSLEVIIATQFGAAGIQPWFIADTPGEMYLKKDWEEKPFIKRVYLPNSLAVGPKHLVLSINPWRVQDEAYEDRQITDEEFTVLRKAGLNELAAKLHRDRPLEKPGEN